MVRVLTFRPSFDLATKYGHAWLGEIRNVASSLGHEVLDLQSGDATATNFFAAMKDFQPDLIIAVGHGNETKFSGQDRDIVMTACTDDQVMNGSQAYFLSCLMGMTLAPSMVSKGAVSVLAYTSEFVWLVHPEYQNTPLSDPYARAFKDAVVEPCRSLLQGATWKQIYDQSIGIFNKGIAEWFDSPEPSAGEIVAALTQDRDNLIVYGEITIGPTQGMFVDGSLYYKLAPIPLATMFMSMLV